MNTHLGCTVHDRLLSGAQHGGLTAKKHLHASSEHSASCANWLTLLLASWVPSPSAAAPRHLSRLCSQVLHHSLHLGRRVHQRRRRVGSRLQLCGLAGGGARLVALDDLQIGWVCCRICACSASNFRWRGRCPAARTTVMRGQSQHPIDKQHCPWAARACAAGMAGARTSAAAGPIHLPQNQCLANLTWMRSTGTPCKENADAWHGMDFHLHVPCHGRRACRTCKAGGVCGQACASVTSGASRRAAGMTERERHAQRKRSGTCTQQA